MQVFQIRQNFLFSLGSKAAKGSSISRLRGLAAIGKPVQLAIQSMANIQQLYSLDQTQRLDVGLSIFV